MHIIDHIFDKYLITPASTPTAEQRENIYKWLTEAYDEGKKHGLKQGYEEGYKRGVEDCITRGHELIYAKVETQDPSGKAD